MPSEYDQYRALVPSSDEPAQPAGPSAYDQYRRPLAPTPPPMPSSEAARIVTLQRKTGLPADVIGRNLDEVEKQAAARDFDPVKFREHSPLLASWMEQHPLNTALARDDLVPLSAMEHTIRFATNAARAVPAGFVKGANLGFFSLLEAGGDVFGNYDLSAWAKGQNAAVKLQADNLKGEQLGAGYYEKVAYGGFESIGTALPILAITLLTKNPALALTAMGTQSGGAAFSDARAQGVPLAQALAYGTANGIVEAWTEALPTKWLLKDLAEHAGLFKTLAHQVVTEGFTEQIATHLQDLSEWALVHPDRPFSDYTSTRLQATIDTAIAVGITVAGQGSAAHTLNRVVSGMASKRATHDLVESAQATTMPKEKVQEYLEHATTGPDGQPTPARFKFASPQTWVDYWRGNGGDPQAEAERLGIDATTYQHAVDNGEDLEIPMPAFAVKMADHAAFWEDEFRDNPGEWNALETKAFLAEEATRQAAQPGGPVPEPTPLERMQRDLSAQLQVGAGMHAVEADTNAALLATLFHQIENVGLNPQKMLDRRFAGVEAGQAPGEQPIGGALRERRRGPARALTPELQAEQDAMYTAMRASLEAQVPIVFPQAFVAPSITAEEDAIAAKEPVLSGTPTFWGYEPGPGNVPIAKFTMQTETGPTQLPASELQRLGIPVPEAPPPPADRVNGEELRRRAMAAKGIPQTFFQTMPAPTTATDRPMFFSRLSQAVEQSKLEKGSVADWVAQIRNAKTGHDKLGLAAVNLEALGEDHTTDQLATSSREPLLFDLFETEAGAQGIYTKQEILDFLKLNQLELVPDVRTEANGDIARGYRSYIVPGPAEHYEEHFLTFPTFPAEGERSTGANADQGPPMITVATRPVPESGAFGRVAADAGPEHRTQSEADPQAPPASEVPGGRVLWNPHAEVTVRPMTGGDEQNGYAVYVDGQRWIEPSDDVPDPIVYADSVADAQAAAQALYAEIGTPKPRPTEPPPPPPIDEDALTEAVDNRIDRMVEDHVTESAIDAELESDVEYLEERFNENNSLEDFYDNVDVGHGFAKVLEEGDEGYDPDNEQWQAWIKTTREHPQGRSEERYGEDLYDSEEDAEQAANDSDELLEARDQAVQTAFDQARQRYVDDNQDRDSAEERVREYWKEEIDRDEVEETVRAEMEQEASPSGQRDERRPRWVDGHGEYRNVVNPAVRLRLDTRVSSAGQTLFITEIQPPKEDERKDVPELLQRTWRPLALKYALALAAKRNMDAVAWATGTQSAALYSLEKAVKKMTWGPVEPVSSPLDLIVVPVGSHEGTTYALAKRHPNGDLGPIVEEFATREEAQAAFLLREGPPSTASDHWFLNIETEGHGEIRITIDPAPKDGKNQHLVVSSTTHLISKGDKLNSTIQNEYIERMQTTGAEGTLEGEGLKFGGAGLMRLYDEDFPSNMNKIPAVRAAKAKVGTVTIDVTSGGAHPQHRHNLEGWAAHGGVTGVVDTPDGDGFTLQLGDGETWGHYNQIYQAQAEMDRWNQRVEKEKEKTHPQPGIVLTPELKAALAGGVSMFQSEPAKIALETSAESAAVTPERFIAARDKSTRGQFLSPLTPADLQGATLYLSPDDTVGGALKPDGDITNLFNNGGPKGAITEVLLRMIADGGITADCFDGFLPQLYVNFGLLETGRMKFNREFAPAGWNYERDGEPDVVFLARIDAVGTPDEIRARMARGREKWLHHTPSKTYHTDYDAARADATETARTAADTRRAGDPGPGRAGSREDVRGDARRADPGAGAPSRRAVAPALAQPQRRAGITFDPTGRAKIALFQHHDRSSFIHEFGGHLYLELIGDAVEQLGALDPAALTDPQKRLVGDFHSILIPWLGPDLREGTGHATRFSVEQHEKFADGVEDYLMTNRAPSLALQPVFARVKAWMLGVYRLVKRNVLLTDEVRGFMDRLLASDDAIAAAEAESTVQPIFTTPESAGMTPERFALYRKTVEAASTQARERLDRKVLADLAREQSQLWKDQRKAIQTEERDKLEAQPIYRALSAIRRGTQPNGQPLVEGQPLAPLRLNRAQVFAAIGEHAAKALPKPYVYTAEGGIDPALVAEMFGFSSAAELLTTIANTPPIETTLQEIVDARMLKEHGGVLIDGTLPDAVQEALAGDGRDQVIRAELRALQALKRTVRPHVQDATAPLKTQIKALTGQVASMNRTTRSGPATIANAIPSERAIAEAAQQRIAATAVRQLHPERFWHAAQKANKTAIAAAAKQDFDGAISAHTQQLINLASYRAAKGAQAEVLRRVEAARALDSVASRKRVGLAGVTYQDQIDGILDRYEFAKVSQKVIERRAEMRAWVASLEAQGYAVELTPAQMDDSRRVNYQELTVAELREVTDGLQQILHLVRLKTHLLDAQDTRTFGAIRDDITGSITTHHEARPSPIEFRPADEGKRTVANWIASHQKMAFIVNALDGYVDGGPFWQAFTRRLNEAADREIDRKTTEGQKYWKIVNAHYPGRALLTLHDKAFIPAIGDSLSKEGRLSVALNYGNPNGRERLLNDPKRRWDAVQVKAILDTLDRRDWEFVKQTWAYNETFWPEIAAQQQRVTGLPPAKVEHLPFETKFGTMPGGYYHIGYDARLSPRAADHEAANLLKFGTAASYVRAATRQGHVEEQLASTGLSLKLELGVQFGHIEEVIHSLTHQEVVSDLSRLLRDTQIRDTIISAKGDIVYDQLKLGLQDVALGTLPAAKTIMEKAASFAKSGTQISQLAYNVWTAAQQPLGWFNGAAEIGPGWVAKGMVRWLRSAATMDETTAWVVNNSPMMRNRWQTSTQDLGDLRSVLRAPGGWFDNLVRTVSADHLTQQTILDSFLWHIGMMQRVADMPVWLGAFAKFSAQHPGDEQLAIALADQAILNSQGGGQIKDLAQVQRGGPIARLYMAFYSYGNMTINQAGKAIGKTRFTSPADVAVLLGNLSLIYVAPAMMTVMLANLFGRRNDDDWDEYLAAVGKESLASAMNGIVVLREFAGLLGEGTRGYAGPAGARLAEMLYSLGGQIKQLEADEAFFKALNQVGGVFLRYPAAQAQKTVDGFLALQAGRTHNPMALLMGPPPKKH